MFCVVMRWSRLEGSRRALNLFQLYYDPARLHQHLHMQPRRARHTGLSKGSNRILGCLEPAAVSTHMHCAQHIGGSVWARTSRGNKSKLSDTQSSISPLSNPVLVETHGSLSQLCYLPSIAGRASWPSSLLGGRHTGDQCGCPWH